MLIEEFAAFKNQYANYPVWGDSEIVGYDKVEIDLSNNIYQAAKSVDYVKDVDNLVPQYLKDVEAKKIC